MIMISISINVYNLIYNQLQLLEAAHLHRSNVEENNVQHKSIAPWLAQANLRLSREK